MTHGWGDERASDLDDQHVGGYDELYGLERRQQLIQCFDQKHLKY